MNSKKMLRVALPLAFAGACGLVYADNEVKLNNDAVTSWDDFVSVINGTTKPTGKVDMNDADIVAAKNDSVQAQATLEEKEGILQEKNDAVADAEKVLNSTESDGVKTILASKEASLKEANTDLETANTNLQNYINSLETAYNNDVATLNTKKDDLSSLQTQQSNKNTELTQASGALTTANTALTKANNALNEAVGNYNKYSSQLNNLSKVTSTVIDDCVKIPYNNATKFQADYKKGDTSSTALVYCCQETYTYGFDDETGTRLILAFGSQPSDGKTWTSYTPVQFSSYIKTLSAPDELSIYLGSKYEELSGSSSEYYECTVPATWNAGNVLTSAVNALSTLNNSPIYQTQVSDYADKDEADRLKGLMQQAEQDEETARANIKTAEANVESAQGKYDEISGELDDLKAQITTLQGEIDTLNKTTIPASKAKWDNAVKGTLEGDETYTGLKNAITTAQNNVTDAQTAVDTAQAAVDAQQKVVDDAKAAAETAQADVNTAQAALTAANNAITAAIKAAQNTANANALANYKTITLNSDVTASTMITSFDGRINGGDHIITVPSGSTLFNEFSGTLSAVGVNGEVAHDAIGSKYANTAIWTGSTGEFYDSKGNPTDATSLGQLGFLARARFGVNFTSGTKGLAALAADGSNKVYDITVYKPTSNQQYYVVINNGAFVPETGKVDMPANMFAKSATADIATMDIANVYYQQGTNNICENVVITDKQNFYAPVDITAHNVDVTRTFTSGMSAVCLPFDLNKDMCEEGYINTICTYDTESPEKFWFTKVDGDIPANTPILMFTSGAVKLNNFGAEVTIKKTDSQINKNQGADGVSAAYGTLKSVTSSEFAGEFNSGKIWGLNSGKFVPAANGSSFPAFRMAIAGTENVEAAALTAAQKPSRYIGIKDVYGNVIIDKYEDGITTGVESVVADNSSLTVSAGDGQLIIKSEADFGEVPVYNMNGNIVAISHIGVGTTTLNVEKGVYIVLGKKVMVK